VRAQVAAILQQQVPVQARAMGHTPEVVARGAVIQTAVPANLHFALDIHTERVGELEGMEEGVGDDGSPLVALRSAPFLKTGNHFGPEDTAVLVR